MAEKDIFKIFDEWVKNKGPREARISVFEHIRDIPYAIIPELRDPHLGPAGILELNKGSCQPKHYLLGLFFEKLSLPVKYMTYPFRWDDQHIEYPDDLKKIVKGLPVSYHLACKSYIDKRWVLVDATWDPQLKKAGFPVNEKWDGINDTVNAVIPIEEIGHGNREERVRYEAERRGLYTDKEKAASSEFIERLNVWLEEKRG
jgi:hypothetical protein